MSDAKTIEQRLSDRERIRLAKDRLVPARITEYLSLGGLFNPELMEHDKVRDLLIDARDVVEILMRERINPQCKYPGYCDCCGNSSKAPT
jgi:hypothetical protein